MPTIHSLRCEGESVGDSGKVFFHGQWQTGARTQEANRMGSKRSYSVLITL
jgi:hypothetical protein